MKIYYIYVSKEGGKTMFWGYDSYDSFIIIAENSTQAREIANESGGDENGWDNDRNVWLDTILTNCEVIGIPDLHFSETGIIISSFNAG